MFVCVICKLVSCWDSQSPDIAQVCLEPLVFTHGSTGHLETHGGVCLSLEGLSPQCPSPKLQGRVFTERKLPELKKTRLGLCR